MKLKEKLEPLAKQFRGDPFPAAVSSARLFLKDRKETAKFALWWGKKTLYLYENREDLRTEMSECLASVENWIKNPSPENKKLCQGYLERIQYLSYRNLKYNAAISSIRDILGVVVEKDYFSVSALNAAHHVAEAIDRSLSYEDFVAEKMIIYYVGIVFGVLWSI